MAVQSKFLKRIHYFSGLSSAELESIKKFVSQETVAKEEIFLVEGEWSDYLYFLVSGMVKVYRTSPDGKEQILDIARPGGSLNDASTFDGGPNATSLLAMTPVTLYEIRKSDLKTILQNHPQVALNAIKVLASRVLSDSSLVKDLSFTKVTGRLAKMLLQHAREETGAGLRLTQQDMAAIVGTTREVINRLLRILEEKGAIRLERRGIVITDKEALEKMVKATS